MARFLLPKVENGCEVRFAGLGDGELVVEGELQFSAMRRAAACTFPYNGSFFTVLKLRDGRTPPEYTNKPMPEEIDELRDEVYSKRMLWDLEGHE